MKIEEGWCFYSADFSILAMSGTGKGSVTFIRDAEGRKKWHEIPESIKENDSCPALFVCGTGHYLEEAIRDANMIASHSKPIDMAFL